MLIKTRLFILVFVMILIFLSIPAAFVQAQTPTPTPPPMAPLITPTPMMPMAAFNQRLAPPPTVYPPTQADDGAQLYYQICMVCHGDHGQGLTDEWRSVLDPPDRNCWQSHCHAPNHPPEGFVFPKEVPAVVGPQMGQMFANGLDLYTYLKAKMPWQAPGSRSDSDYWQLTAFLLRLNGVDLGNTILTPQTAADVWLNPQARPTPTPQPALFHQAGRSWPAALIWVLSVLALAALVGFFIFLVKYREGHH